MVTGLEPVGGAESHHSLPARTEVSNLRVTPPAFPELTFLAIGPTAKPLLYKKSSSSAGRCQDDIYFTKWRSRLAYYS